MFKSHSDSLDDVDDLHDDDASVTMKWRCWRHDDIDVMITTSTTTRRCWVIVMMSTSSWRCRRVKITTYVDDETATMSTSRLCNSVTLTRRHQRCFNIITTTASSSSCHCNETTTMSTTLQRRWITTRDVATGLISTHATQKTDAIVTKSCGRGHSLFRRLFTGPISAQWLRHATVIKPLHLPVQTGVPCPAACAVPSPCPGVCPSLFYYDRCGLSSKDLS